MQKYDPKVIQENLKKWQAQQLLREARKPSVPLTYHPFAALREALRPKQVVS